MSIFDELTGAGESDDATKAAERFNSDISAAVRLLMDRREGRALINWLIEGQDVREIMLRVMQYVEETHG